MTNQSTREIQTQEKSGYDKSRIQTEPEGPIQHQSRDGFQETKPPFPGDEMKSMSLRNCATKRN